ncbi:MULTISPECIES: bacillithiol biosynthesis cysteine-adding enzyme BshC [Flavobacteriaceae]|uniref:bacillithiol biosynthesis cysteine-adding enzyme BshC n=1 Tax=Flavobacteriaceae TaxID=49546 RepID=UPI001492D226|nr:MULTISPECIES: bacillithiol biosynthesis cysteine-adding enzyme BshC [Allomuricauda]MDC6367080.1 bacillithiol biosynthesis cysteine-adding enzyme BshC [Muricauda sp. AC10]
MEVDCIPFKETGYFSKLICDYLEQQSELEPFFNRFPTIDGFKDQIEEKKANYPTSHRKVLVDALTGQYNNHSTSKATQENIESLHDENTFTIVTGHQLNLFTGPLYFLYKIVSTINLAKKLKEQYPKQHFVPIYWMATEDHDFDEINFFNFQGKRFLWNRQASGAVGELDTEGIDAVLNTFSAHLSNNDNAEKLKAIFRKAYLEHSNLADATRYLANELFGEYGLVILDGNDAQLKRLLVPFAKRDIFENLPHQKVQETIKSLSKVSKDYTIQVNPRQINYFYLKENLRERIEQKNGKYHVVNTQIEFTPSELEKELEEYPERFSPNVIARPLYQEIILPNLCYIGGGGELAYWLELKSYFEALGITFPTLLLRNSVVAISEKQLKKIEKLELNVSDLFMKQPSLINKKIRKISNIDIDFSPQKKLLEEQFKNLYELAEQTDKSFLGAVKAQEIKQKKGLDALEKRLLKAQKKKLKDHVVRITQIQNEVFPVQSLQERQVNFSELYLELGSGLIPFLIKELDPFCGGFLVLKY